jgi:cell wall-associated NlpC family hydrolase
VRNPLLVRLVVVVLGVVLTAATLTVAAPAPAAHAAPASATATQQQSHLTARQRFMAKAEKVLEVVRDHRGDPYQYGATGPNAFDCSGLVLYSFRKALGRNLPRVANDQKRASRRIWHRRNLRPGDLVFEVNSRNYAYHVGIYAGHGYFWHAPHSGSHVKRQKMYPARWRFGRVINS